MARSSALWIDRWVKLKIWAEMQKRFGESGEMQSISEASWRVAFAEELLAEIRRLEEGGDDGHP